MFNIFKKIIFFFIFLFVLTVSNVCFASQILNVYTWSNYIPSDVYHEFERKTGIHVNISEYDSNETMYAKLKADPEIGFDVIIPSSYYVQRMIREKMLQPLDKSKLPNIKFLMPTLLNKQFDPNNQYSLPYFWGVTGIVVNDNYYHPNDVTTWEDFWQKKYKNQLLLLNDVREVFAIALITLGYPPNDTNPEHIKQAYLKLEKLLPNIKLFNSDAATNVYIDEDAAIGMGWNGDVYLATLENPHIKFIYPKNHFMLWIDCMAIPKNAPHLNNAYRFMNFLMQPDIAERISMEQGYPPPNWKAMQMLPENMRENPIFNPPQQALERADVMLDIGSAIDVYENYWEKLKLGGNG